MPSTRVRRRLCIVIIRSLVGEDCYPSLLLVAEERSFVVTRHVRARRCRLRVVIIRSLGGDDCDRSLLLVAGGRSLVVTRRALVPRRLFVVACALSSFVRSLRRIEVLRCLSSPFDNCS